MVKNPFSFSNLPFYIFRLKEHFDRIRKRDHLNIDWFLEVGLFLHYLKGSHGFTMHLAANMQWISLKTLLWVLCVILGGMFRRCSPTQNSVDVNYQRDYLYLTFWKFWFCVWLVVALHLALDFQTVWIGSPGVLVL